MVTGCDRQRSTVGVLALYHLQVGGLYIGLARTPETATPRSAVTPVHVLVTFQPHMDICALHSSGVHVYVLVPQPLPPTLYFGQGRLSWMIGFHVTVYDHAPPPSHTEAPSCFNSVTHHGFPAAAA